MDKLKVVSPFVMGLVLGASALWAQNGAPSNGSQPAVPAAPAAVSVKQDIQSDRATLKSTWAAQREAVQKLNAQENSEIAAVRSSGKPSAEKKAAIKEIREKYKKQREEIREQFRAEREKMRKDIHRTGQAFRAGRRVRLGGK